MYIEEEEEEEEEEGDEEDECCYNTYSEILWDEVVQHFVL